MVVAECAYMDTAEYPASDDSASENWVKKEKEEMSPLKKAKARSLRRHRLKRMRSQPLIPVPPNVPADATSPRDSPSPQQPDIPSLNVLHSPPPVIATPAPIATIPTPSTSSGASHASVAELSVGRLIMVSNRLPITVTLIESSGKYQYARSSGGLVAGISGLAARMPFVWVGWPGLAVPTEAQNDVRNDLRDQYDAIPVFMSDELVKGHYVGFCNRILWPLFHYHPSELAFSLLTWQAYEAANRLFASTLIPHLKPYDTVWIHDLHLMLLPRYLKEAMPPPLRGTVKIGFFLHTPFPSSEVYRILPQRKEILRGVLESDLCGFQTYDYARHFMSSCTRILGLHCFPDGIEFEGRKVKVGTYPIGIEPEKFHRALATSEKVHAHIARLRARFRGVRVMVGIDRLDYIKALPQKLHAFARLLETHPEFRDGKCVLIQVAVPSREDVLEYQNLDRVVNELVGEVNGKYGGIESVPVHYVHKSVSFDELVALYAVADVCVVTSTRDGMNLVSYEFIASQQGQHGVLLLSEFAGAAQSLNGAIIVNPWNTEELAQGMYEALTMPPKAKKINYDKLSRYVNKYTSERWGTTFVTELRGLSNGCENRLIPLKVGDILAKFRSSKHKKIFFIDYDGTLKSSHTLPELANPSGHVREIIRKLSKLPNTLVYIFSGRSRACLDSWFGDINVGLSAEHGCFYRHPPAAKFNEALLDLLLESDAGAGISSAQHSPTLQGQTNALLRSCSFPNLPILGNTSTAAQAVLQKSFAKNAASSLIPSPMPFVSPLLRRGNAGKGTMASMTSVSSLVGNPAAGTALDASSPISLGSAGSMATLRAPRVLQQGWLALVDPEVVEGIDGHRAWSNQIRPLFDYYTERTPGSFVEEKEVNLTWHYRKADPEFGVWQAAELHVNLEQILNHLGVSVILGNKTVEVRPSMTDKSTAARSVINDLTQAGEIVDFFCSIGDGKTDEVLFQYLNETFGGDTPLDDSVVPMTEKPPAYQVVTCTVGKKQTNAKWVLDNVKEVERFLDEFADTAGTATSAISPLFSDVSVVGDDRRDGAKRLRGESGKRIVVPPRPTADLPASELVDVAKKLSAARTALVGLGVHGIVEKK